MHPDVHFTFPVITKKSGEKPISADYITEWRGALHQQPYMNANEWLQSIGAENQQGNITVRECHEIIRNLNLKTYDGSYKVQIIWLAEYLKETGNTLLKIIEEPPAGTIFILIVENAELVLNTILSRTQIIKVNAIEDEDIKEALLQRFAMDEKSAKRIARISEGNFNSALAMADGHENANDKLLRQWFGYCFNLKTNPTAKNAENLVAWIDEISKVGRENQKIFLKYALFFLRECNALLTMGNTEKLEGEELDFAKRFSARLDEGQIETLTGLLNNLYYHIERNANPKILFMSNSFKVAGVFDKALSAI